MKIATMFDDARRRAQMLSRYVRIVGPTTMKATQPHTGPRTPPISKPLSPMSPRGSTPTTAKSITYVLTVIESYRAIIGFASRK